jgi:hypothetical protein
MSSDPQSSEPTAIRDVVRRLSRPDSSGGSVIERAAIMAEGADSQAIIRWIVAHAGQPEAIAPPATAGGLHGSRLSGGAAEGRPPRRYVLPADALL